jgi:Spy/CpxP family protein refolding chaperone
MLRLALIVVTTVSVGAAVLAQAPTAAPYAGQQLRDIKALSPEDIRDLVEGRGMGLAKAAELNGYPGPSHVLELAADLRLTPTQRAATEALYQRMLADAKRLGEAILTAERDLDRRFADRRIDAASLRRATTAVAGLQGELRAVHLAAHLEQVTVLTPHQISEYAKRRGYHAASEPGHKGHGQH